MPQLRIYLVVNQVVCVGLKSTLTLRAVSLGRFTKSNISNLQEVIVGMDVASVQWMDTVSYYLPHKAHIILNFYSLLVSERQHNIHNRFTALFLIPYAQNSDTACQSSYRQCYKLEFVILVLISQKLQNHIRKDGRNTDFLVYRLIYFSV